MTQTFNVGARSRFVTAVAWVFIVIGALASGSALLQHASVVSMAASGPPPLLPASSGLAGRLLASYLPWLAVAGLGLSLATLAAAVGLLLRLDWARRTLIALLATAILANLLGLRIQHEVVQSVVDATLAGPPLPPQAHDVFGGFVAAARWMGVVVTLGACGVLAWVIGRLTSAAVRQEFG